MLVNLSSRTPLSDYIRKKVFNERRNYNVVIKGPTQTRKSTIGESLALEIDPRFDLIKQMAVIEPRDMMDKLNQPKLGRGRVIFLDEIGVGMNKKTWFSVFNKALNSVMQTFGWKGWVIIATAPYMNFVDKDVKKLFDMEITIQRKDDRRKEVLARVVELQYNEDLDYTYKHFLRGLMPDGRIVPIDAWVIEYPKKDKLDAYFKIANLAKRGLHDRLNATVKHTQLAEERIASFNPNEFAEKIVLEPEKFITTYRGMRYIDKKKIMNEFNIGMLRAHQIKVAADSKLNLRAYEKSKVIITKQLKPQTTINM